MKKAMSIILAVACVLGMSVASFAATPKIQRVTKAIDSNDSYDLELITPNSKLEYDLTEDMFEWSEGKVGKAGKSITRSQVRAADLKVAIPSRYNASVVKEVRLDTGNSSSKVIVEFIDTYTDTRPKKFDFTVSLYIGRQRQAESQIRLTGEFGNREIEVYEDDTYVDLSRGYVAKAMDYIRDIDVYLGSGVYMNTKMFKNKKYTGVAKEDITEADSLIFDKNRDLETIIRLNVNGLDTRGKVTFELDNEYYVYGEGGKYLGESTRAVPFSKVYYMTNKKVTLKGLTGSGKQEEYEDAEDEEDEEDDTINEPTSKEEPKPATGAGAITTSSARSRAQSALDQAGASKSVLVRFLDPTSISPEAYSAIHSVGSASGRSMTVLADTMSGKAVNGRISFQTTSKAPSNTIDLAVKTDSKSVKYAKDKFSKWFKNDIAVVNMAHKGSFGMTVNVAVKANLNGMDTKNLRFYSYDRSSNTYNSLTNTQSFVDKNGFLHFRTSYGGDIIISNGALAR